MLISTGTQKSQQHPDSEVPTAPGLRSPNRQKWTSIFRKYQMHLRLPHFNHFMQLSSPPPMKKDYMIITGCLAQLTLSAFSKIRWFSVLIGSISHNTLCAWLHTMRTWPWQFKECGKAQSNSSSHSSRGRLYMLCTCYEALTRFHSQNTPHIFLSLTQSLASGSPHFGDAHHPLHCNLPFCACLTLMGDLPQQETRMMDVLFSWQKLLSVYPALGAPLWPPFCTAGVACCGA